MSDISQIKVGDELYDIKDAVARASGGGEIGYLSDGQTITVRGSNVFGLLIFSGSQEIGAFGFDSSDYANTVNLYNFAYSGDEISFDVPGSEYAFYIIFGADSIEV